MPQSSTVSQQGLPGSCAEPATHSVVNAVGSESRSENTADLPALPRNEAQEELEMTCSGLKTLSNSV